MEMKKVLQKWENKSGKKIGKMYKNSIQRFVTCSNIEVEKANYQDILNYIKLLRLQGIKARNLKNNLCAIKFYYRCLLDLELIENHPCRGLMLKDKIDKRIDTGGLYSEEEIKALLQRSFEKSIKTLQLRNKIIVQLLVYQGLKTSELVKLETKDIDLEKCEIQITDSRILKLESQQIMILYKYLNQDRKALKGEETTDILLLSRSGKALPSETISSIINYKENQRFIPRKIRQSVIYHLLKRGEQLRKVQLFAGHKYISSTEAYLSGDLSELKTAINKHHPLM